MASTTMSNTLTEPDSENGANALGPPQRKRPRQRRLDSDQGYGGASVSTQNPDQMPSFDMGLTDTDDSEAQVYLSVVWGGGKLGAAIYDVDSTEVLMMPDVVDTDDYVILKSLIHQIKPSLIVSSSKQDDRFLKAINAMARTTLGELDEYVHLLPSIDYNLDMCKRRILYLPLPSIPESYDDSERTLYMSSLVDFECVCMVRAVGGMLKFLEKKRIGIELEDLDARVPVLSLRTFSLDSLVMVDENTLGALQVFHVESHPSVYKHTSGREGLSLFGLMNKCRCKPGSKLLRLWFLRPTRDMTTLSQRQDAIAFFKNPRHVEVTATLQNCLKNIRSISMILNTMSRAEATPRNWHALYKTLYNAICIKDICKAQSADIGIFRKVASVFADPLHTAANMISRIMDFEESLVQERFVVKPNFDPRLDEKKRTFNGLPDFMTKIAKDELTRLEDQIEECNVIYLPQVGYLIAIPMVEGEEERIQQLPGMEYMFTNNTMAHFKNESTEQLDSMLGDLQCDIVDMETKIMHDVEGALLEQAQLLNDVIHCAAELDCLISLGISAREQNYTRPEMAEETGLYIIGARHPLQELCCDPYMPNDIISGVEDGKMKILTGPNASGKSVYIKQAALLVYLAHIGSFVPAESATIGLVDAIFTRISTLESVSVGLSAFMIDLNQMARAVGSATEKSLVIIDEFGKGTETEDGIALLCACLRYWLKGDDVCPHVLVSTHFHSVIQQRLLPVSPLVRYQTMEVLEEDGELCFLFQLKDGSTNTSHACHIAAAAGLPEVLVKRGEEASDLIRQNKVVSRRDQESTRDLNKRCETIVNRFMALDLDTGSNEDFLQNFVLPCTQGTLEV